MGQVAKISSNATGLRRAEEATPGVLPGSPVWVPMEPNSYGDFGSTLTLLARTPINDGRQRKKGNITDLDAVANFSIDLTPKNFSEDFQGFFFADFRRKAEFGYGSSTQDITGIATSDDSYSAASGLNIFRAGDLVFASGFSNALNNGLKQVATAASGKITVTTNLADETPGADVGSLVQVGFQFGSGEVDIDATVGAYPKLVRVSGTKDFTQFGLIPGEFVFIGGDLTAEKFSTAANNGFCRVRSVSASEIVFDKTASTMVDETGTGKTIRIFFGRVLKNEIGSSIVTRTYQFERTLGAPDSSQPTEIQSQYVKGSYANELTMNVPTANKVTLDLAYVSLDEELRDGPTGVKSGSRPSIEEADCFNTSSDVTKFKIQQHSATDSNPSALFSYIEDLKFKIVNNITPDKAVGVLGGFDASAGFFTVSAEVTAYFANVSAISLVRSNADVTLEMHLVKSNGGISLDLPLIALGNGKLNVEPNTAIKIPLTQDAATASKIATDLNHTALMVFWDYLPNAADA